MARFDSPLDTASSWLGDFKGLRLAAQEVQEEAGCKLRCLSQQFLSFAQLCSQILVFGASPSVAALPIQRRSSLCSEFNFGRFGPSFGSKGKVRSGQWRKDG